MTGFRIAVTGLGVISAIGKDRQTFWDSLVAGRSGIRPHEFDVPSNCAARFEFSKTAAVLGFDPETEFTERGQQVLDRFAQFALISAREAIADSGLEWDDAMRARTGVVTGCGIGGSATLDDGYRRIYLEGKRGVWPMLIPNTMPNAGASQVSMAFGFRGPSFTLSTACASSSHAIGMAAWVLRAGAAEVMLAGGSESLLNYGSLKAWDALRVVSADTCRPFSASKPGMILGEGGAMMVLEPADRAEARGARIYAELVGFGMSADAHHITAPSLEGPTAAMREALRDGGLAPEDVDYINAHGTGTAGNDPNEIRAIKEVFGAHARRLAVSSTKSMHGHTIGAAGAIEATATCLAIHHGVLPPTANLDVIDPDCDLDVVPNQSRPATIRAALSNSFAFGGLNAVLAFRRPARA